MRRLQRATMEDRIKSVEPTGEPTDIYRVMASKTFGVPYPVVTEQQRRAVKSAVFFNRYQ